MTDEEAQKVLDELQEVRQKKLNGEAKRLFEAIMKIADQRDLAKRMAEQLQKEFLKQEKIIQAMANDIYIEITKPDGSHFVTVEEVIEYFEEKVGK